MIVKLTDHHLEFLSLKGSCKGLSESTLVKMRHCWKSHVMAHIICLFVWFNALHPSQQPWTGESVHPYHTLFLGQLD